MSARRIYRWRLGDYLVALYPIALILIVSAAAMFLQMHGKLG